MTTKETNFRRSVIRGNPRQKVQEFLNTIDSRNIDLIVIPKPKPKVDYKLSVMLEQVVEVTTSWPPQVDVIFQQQV